MLAMYVIAVEPMKMHCQSVESVASQFWRHVLHHVCAKSARRMRPRINMVVSMRET